MRLTAAVYNDNYAAPVFQAAYADLADVGISWELPGGVRSMTATIKLDRWAAFGKYREYALQRLVLQDGYCDKPVATGDITKLTYGYGKLTIEARGPWWRLYDGLENTIATTADTTDDVIKRALTAHAATTVSADQTHIAATTANCYMTLPSGNTTATTAGKLVDAGATFITSGVVVGDIAFDNTGGSFCTIMAIDDENTLGVTNDIFVNGDAYVIRRPVISGHTTDTLANYIVDQEGPFLKAQIAIGTTVCNLTDTTKTTTAAAAAWRTIQLTDDIFTKDEQYVIVRASPLWVPPYEGIPVADVVSEMVGYGDGTGAPVYFWLQETAFDVYRRPIPCLPYLELYSATADADWQVWRRDLQRAEIGRDFANLATSVTALWTAGQQSVAQTNNTSTYWTRQRVVSGRGAVLSMANEKASVYVNTNSDGILRRAWVITAPRIMDGSGFRWPLWRVIAHGGGYLRCNDAFPDAGTAGYDREKQGRITTMDYSYRNNQLRVTLDDDTRADRRFRDLGYDEAINRRLRVMMQPYVY